jgi:transcriptional regulator with XRE-family HTH domain
MPPPARDQGPFLREWRKSRGFSLVDLAKRVGTTQGTLSRYETGRRAPRPEILQKLATALVPSRQVGELFVSPEVEWRTRQLWVWVGREREHETAYVAAQLAEAMHHEPELADLLVAWQKLTPQQRELLVAVAKAFVPQD